MAENEEPNSTDDLALHRIVDHLKDMETHLMEDKGRFRVRGKEKDVCFSEIPDTSLRTVLLCILYSLFDGHMCIPELNTIQNQHISADEIDKKFPCRLPSCIVEAEFGQNRLWIRQLVHYHLQGTPNDPILDQETVQKVRVDQTLLMQYLKVVKG